ncbi:MAG: hypothetical protein K9M45_04150 [Kiritimatiellales bacterium]|nr:hypothetical protein [Kiritimatiellales bacterium]
MKTFLSFIFVMFIASFLVRADEFQGLGKLGSASTSAEGVSPDGTTVVGSANAEAISWTVAGGLVSLSGSSILSYAYGASSDGSVIIGYFYSEDLGDYRACRWTASGMEVIRPQIDVPVYSAAWDISADGSVIVGEKDTEEGREAFRSLGVGALLGLGDLEGGSFNSAAYGASGNGSVVVGRGRSGSGYEAFRWTAAGMIGLGDLDGGSFYSSASAVSDDGSVVVGYGSSSNGGEAFRWTPSGGMVGIGDLPGGDFYSWANDVSANGSVVVGRSKTANGQEAFIWDAVNGMRNLKDVLEAGGLDLTGWLLETATGVSADGCTITGNGENPEGSSEAWVAMLDESAPNDFLITSFSTDLPSGNTSLQWNSISGTTYQVEYTDALTNTDWNLLLPVTSISNETVLVHTNGLDSSTDARFYRILLDP